MPSLDRLQAHKDLNNLMIFPINVGQENLQKSTNFFEDLKINNLNIYFDSQVTLAKKFGLRGIPTSVLFDKNGLEFARIIGSIDFEDEKFIKWLSNFN
jgi:thioredoxin-related protein